MLSLSSDTVSWLAWLRRRLGWVAAVGMHVVILQHRCQRIGFRQSGFDDLNGRRFQSTIGTDSRVKYRLSFTSEREGPTPTCDACTAQEGCLAVLESKGFGQQTQTTGTGNRLEHGRTGLAGEQVAPRHERGILLLVETAAGGVAVSALSVSPHPPFGTMGAKVDKSIGKCMTPQTLSPRYLSHVLFRQTGEQVLISGTPNLGSFAYTHRLQLFRRRGFPHRGSFSPPHRGTLPDRKGRWKAVCWPSAGPLGLSLAHDGGAA